MDLAAMAGYLNDLLATQTGLQWAVSASTNTYNQCVVLRAVYKDGNWRNGHTTRVVHIYFDEIERSEEKAKIISMAESTARDWARGLEEGVYHA